VFKPLHDAYVQGRLRIGMEVIYADGVGRIRHYRITTWRVVLPTDGSWIGAFARPTMILQTCVGANSTYRLNVKLVAVVLTQIRDRRQPIRSPRILRGDYEPLDLARPLADLGELGIPEEPLDRVLGHVAIAAVDLDRGVRDPRAVPPKRKASPVRP